MPYCCKNCTSYVIEGYRMETSRGNTEDKAHKNGDRWWSRQQIFATIHPPLKENNETVVRWSGLQGMPAHRNTSDKLSKATQLLTSHHGSAVPHGQRFGQAAPSIAAAAPEKITEVAK